MFRFKFVFMNKNIQIIRRRFIKIVAGKISDWYLRYLLKSINWNKFLKDCLANMKWHCILDYKPKYINIWE